MARTETVEFTNLPAGSLCRPLFLCSRQKRIVKRGNRFFRGMGKETLAVQYFTREKGSVCEQSSHTLPDRR